MKFKRIIGLIMGSLLILSGCARDLSNNVYTSDSTLNLTLEGEILSVRPVIIKNSDTLSDNAFGGAAGGITGGIAGSNAGRGRGNSTAIAAGSLAGVLIGAMIESKLSTADGIEYIVKVDKSNLSDEYYTGTALMRDAIAAARINGLITIVTGKDEVLAPHEKVYVILSPKRARVIRK